MARPDRPNEKRAQAEKTLSADLHAAFDLLIEDYKNSAEAHTGRIWVNYNILADLVRAGWRRQNVS